MTGVYDLHLVVLSVVVASVASYTALDLASHIYSRRHASPLWLIGGATALGIGIWSMHFIGMLAFRLPIPIAYEAPLMLVSLLIAIVVSAFALFAMQRPVLRATGLWLSATLIGVGISSMHYTGMFAMAMAPPIQYQPFGFLLSVLIAIGAAFVALWIAFELRNKHDGMEVFARVGSACVMGLAISGMHYTGMWAAQFAPDSVCLASGLAGSIEDSVLATAVGTGSLVILGATLGLSAYNAHVAARTATLAKALQLANEQLRAAFYDPLTKLPNRVLLEDRSQQAMLRAMRNGTRFALLFIDLDRFKPVNDSFGHHTGDALLVRVGKRLTRSVRQEDTVARTGGDEFVVLLSSVTNPVAVATVCEKILQELSRPFHVERQQVSISCSIGASIYPEDSDDLRTLMINADKAMYRAKSSGRNGYRLFGPMGAQGFR
ncbi:MAG: diguanylate cyclase domain-containing protein [Burkholderiales bacterium]